MSVKLAKRMVPQCQHRSQCIHDATWGVFVWRPGESTVDLTKPWRVYCSRHKPKHHNPGSCRRNVRLP